MALLFMIDPDSRIITTKGIGKLSLEELRANMELVLAHRLYRPGMDEIYDFRGVKALMGMGSKGYSDILDLISVDQEN